MPCTEQDFQKFPLDFVRDAHAIMWNNGSLYPIEGKFVDESVCAVVPKGSTWVSFRPCLPAPAQNHLRSLSQAAKPRLFCAQARNPIPRIHTDNIGMAFVGKCLGQRGTQAYPYQGLPGAEPYHS